MSLYAAPEFSSEKMSKAGAFIEITCMARANKKIPPKLGRVRPQDILTQNMLNRVETKRAPVAHRVDVPRKSLEKGKTGLNHIQG